MTSAFQYRPKFVDIRVNKPGKERAPKKPEERACDHIGCSKSGQHKAPKSRERTNEYWFFCLEHASDYNRRWNYFEGMKEGEFQNFQKNEEVGHRPLWTFRPGRQERLSATRFFKAAAPGDAYGVFESGDGPGGARTAPRRRLSKLQALALDTLSLEENADAAAIRGRYAELVKRLHPDSNGGDRSAEAHLQKVVQAYQTLKQGGLT